LGAVPVFPRDVQLEGVTAVRADGERSRGSIVFLRCRSGGASLPSRIASQGRQRETGLEVHPIAGRQRIGDMKTFIAAALSAVIAVSLAPGLSSAQGIR